MSSAERAPSPDGTMKKTDTLGTTEEPNILKGYGSVPGVMDEVTRVVDHKAERRLCRKFDYRLLPILAIMCMSTQFCHSCRTD
jgi:hypothetical protein